MPAGQKRQIPRTMPAVPADDAAEEAAHPQLLPIQKKPEEKEMPRKASLFYLRKWIPFCKLSGCSYVLFLTGKKRTKRSRHRGGAEAKSIGTTSLIRHFYPDSEPPSPMYPTRPGRRSFSCRISKTTTASLTTGAGNGVWGEGGSKSRYHVSHPKQYRQTLRSTPPPSRFLWLLSCSETRK